MTKFEKAYVEFSQKLADLQRGKAGNRSELESDWIKENRLRDRIANLKKLGEATDDLEEELKAIEAKVSAQGGVNALKERPATRDQILEAAVNEPDSELHQLALQVQEVGVSYCAGLRADVEALRDEIEEAKKAYLAKIQELGELQRHLYDSTFKLYRCEQCLPKDTRQAKRPQRAVKYNEIEVADKPLYQSYGTIPHLHGVNL